MFLCWRRLGFWRTHWRVQCVLWIKLRFNNELQYSYLLIIFNMLPSKRKVHVHLMCLLSYADALFVSQPAACFQRWYSPGGEIASPWSCRWGHCYCQECQVWNLSYIHLNLSLFNGICYLMTLSAPLLFGFQWAELPPMCLNSGLFSVHGFLRPTMQAFIDIYICWYTCRLSDFLKF